MTSYAEFFAQKPSPPARAPVPSHCLLQRFLHPLSPTKFHRQWFLRRPLHLCGTQEKFADWFDLEAFRRCAFEGTRGGIEHFQIDAHFRNNPRDVLFPIHYAQIGQLLDAGSSVGLANAHLVDENLYGITRALKRQLGFAGPVGVNAYLSRKGGGLGTHFDSKVATAIQITGRKRWRYSKTPAFPIPRRAVRVRENDLSYGATEHLPLAPWEVCRPPREADFEEVILSPGELLCLPPGHWHAAEALEDSLSLNLNFTPQEFMPMIEAAIHGELIKRLPWRAGPPCSFPSPTLDPPAAVETYFRNRLREAKQALQKLEEDLTPLWHAWHTAVNEAEESRSETPPMAARKWRKRTDAPLAWSKGSRSAIHVHGGSSFVTLPSSARPLVALLHQSGEIDLKALPARQRALAEKLIRMLAEIGVVEPVPDQSL